MKGIFKKAFKIAAVLTALMCLYGCFDRRELNTLAYVLGVAIDMAEKEGETELTLQMANVANESSKGSKTSKEGSTGGAAYINISNTGLNINTIIRGFEYKISRRIYMPHSMVILIGEDLAKAGVRDSLDFFARAPEARMTQYICVVKGRAADVFEIDPEFEKAPSNELHHLLEGQKVTSQVPIVTEFEFVSTMLSKTTSPVAPLIEIKEEDGTKRAMCMGSAVFKDGKMIGEIGFKETRGMLWVKDEVKSGIMLLDVLDVRTTVEIRTANCKVKPEIKEDGTILFKVEAETMVGIGDQTGTVNLAEPKNMPALLKESERMITEEIQSAVDKSKELNADIFGFGEFIMRKYPDKWKDMESKWDELYKDIKVEISVKVKADGSGRTVKPITPEKES